MSLANLISLSKEEIHERALSHHELWVVKMGEDIHGPFEADVLKEFAAQNEELFDEALASRLDTNDFQPFFSHALFQRRHPQVIKTERPADNGPVWLLESGLKVGPIQRRDLEKRLEMGTVALTDLVSVNDGHTWIRLYEVSGFDRRTHTADQLPFAPYDSSFQKAKIELVEKMEAREGLASVNEELAEVAHHHHLGAKVIPLKIEEIAVPKAESTTAVSPAMKWVPTAVAVALVVVGGTGYMITRDGSEAELATTEEQSSGAKKTRAQQPARAITKLPGSQEMPVRRPASIPNQPFNPNAQRSVDSHFGRDSAYPTQLETHMGQHHPGTSPQDNYFDAEAVTPVNDNEVHSLVQQDQPMDQPLDAVMGGGEADSPPPPVDEVSDF